MSDSKIKSFPKIIRSDKRGSENIFNNPKLLITEKIDGSYLAFLKDNSGKVHYHSKNQRIYPGLEHKLFTPAINYIESIKKSLPSNIIFYGETLSKPHHSTLQYNRIPKNHIILFDAWDTKYNTYITRKELEEHALLLNLECVPIIKSDNFDSFTETCFNNYLSEHESILGGLMEGLVFKVHEERFLGSIYQDCSVIKYVTNKFKEVNKSTFKKHNKESKFASVIDKYCTEARYQKSYQHLLEEGKIYNDMSDLKHIIPSSIDDLMHEESNEILADLGKIYLSDFLRIFKSKIPLWYKKKLNNC